MMEEMTFYSVLIEWEYECREAGEFGWAGWATCDEEAELKTRAAMIEEEPDCLLCDGVDAAEVGGDVLEIVRGVHIWNAARAADRIDELIAAARGSGHDDLIEIQRILRPRGYSNS